MDSNLIKYQMILQQNQVTQKLTEETDRPGWSV